MFKVEKCPNFYEVSHVARDVVSRDDMNGKLCAGLVPGTVELSHLLITLNSRQISG
jgi:hypothetical protein